MLRVTVEKVRPSMPSCTKHKIRVRTVDSGQVLSQKSRTFPTQKKAKIFKENLENHFKTGGYSFLNGEKKYCTIRVVINDYLTNIQTKSGINTKAASLLKRIANTPFGLAPADNLHEAHWYSLAADMSNEWRVKPQTTANNLSILNSALKDCVTILRYRINLGSYSNAISTARRKGYIARSNARTRRPTSDELTKITITLKNEELAKPRTIPMLDIFEFACETAARLGEICGNKITWGDWDANSGLLTIRNRKNPKKGTTVTSRFKLSAKSIEIIMRQPRGRDIDPIFPYNPRSVGAAWRRLNKSLDIVDLHFRDLRAEALCRLYEAGWSLSAISKVSGHRSLDILNNFYLRYYPTLPSRLAA